MTALIIRFALTAMAVGFVGWMGYVVYLGLVSFFGKKVHDNDKKRFDKTKTTKN